MIKISKYKALEAEIEKRGELKNYHIASNSGTDKHINKVPGNPSLYEILKKKTLCKIAHLLQRVLSM